MFTEIVNTIVLDVYCIDKHQLLNDCAKNKRYNKYYCFQLLLYFKYINDIFISTNENDYIGEGRFEYDWFFGLFK